MIKLYNDDCINVMKNIEDNSIDCILTDPPYGIDFQSEWKVKEKRFNKVVNDEKPFMDFIKEIPRVLKEDGCVFVFTRWDKQQLLIDEFLKYNMKVRSVIIWDKIYHTMGDLKRAFARKYESILFVSNDKFRFPNKRPKDIITVRTIPPQKLIHPNQKPVELFEKLLSYTTKEDDIVLDLFMGTGSIGIASVNLNRKYIGIEIDNYYFKIAEARIEETIKKKR